jgi:hypothetical protein
MVSQPLALLVLVALLAAAAGLNLLALLGLDPESRQKLARSLSGFRKLRIVLLLAVLLVFRARGVPSMVALLVIIAGSYVYQLSRLSDLGLPKRYVQRYWLSAALAFIGMLAFTGLILQMG